MYQVGQEHDASETRGTNADATAPAASIDDAVEETLGERIDAGINRLLEAFEEKLKYDASKQQIVDRLYDELQGYRKDLLLEQTRPLIHGLIRHHAQIGKLMEAIRDASADEVSPSKFCHLLETLQEDVEDILVDNGVAAYRAELSDRFDPVRQTVVGTTVPTTDEDRSGTVAACLGPGFEREGRILAKARVSTYRFEPSPLDS